MVLCRALAVLARHHRAVRGFIGSSWAWADRSPPLLEVDLPRGAAPAQEQDG